MSDKSIKLNECSELSILITKVFDAWGLSPIERPKLLGLSSDTFSQFVSGENPVAPDSDLTIRICHILAIYEILHDSDLDRPDRADKWPTTPNKMLGGKRPVDLMCSLDELKCIRYWLEEQNAY